MNEPDDPSLPRTALPQSAPVPRPADRPAPEMNEMPVLGVSVLARIRAHRRDEHPIRKRQVSNREWIKQAGACAKER